MLSIIVVFFLIWIILGGIMMKESWDFMDLPSMCSKKRIMTEDDTFPRFGGIPNQSQVWDLNGMGCPKIYH